MKTEKIKWWLVVDGSATIVQSTRKDMRKWLKKNKGLKVNQYLYCGKIVQRGKHEYFVVDFGENPC